MSKIPTGRPFYLVRRPHKHSAKKVPYAVKDRVRTEDMISLKRGQRARLWDVKGAVERKSKRRRKNGSTWGTSTPLRLIAKVEGPSGNIVRVYKNADWGEYVVKPSAKSRESSWYHTDDKADAVATAKAIAEGRRSNSRKKVRGTTANPPYIVVSTGRDAKSLGYPTKAGALRMASKYAQMHDRTLNVRELQPDGSYKTIAQYTTVNAERFGEGSGFRSNKKRRTMPKRRKNAPRSGPSVATLVKVLGPHFEHEGHSAKEAAKKVKAAMQIGRRNCLEVANRLLGGHGVESIGDFHNYPPSPELDYVNMGHTYTATLVYDYRTRRFYATSWGDIVERQERRFRDL